MGRYFKFFTLSFSHSLKNSKSLIGLTIFLITCLLIFSNLWKVLSAQVGAVEMTPQQLLWYIALNEWVLVSLPHLQDEMEQDLKTGRLAHLLPRPISYLFSTFFEGLGILSVNLIVLGFVTFTFAWLSTGSFPFTPFSFLLTLLLGFLAGCVGHLFQMMVGLSAFWLEQVEPFHWIWEKFLFTLGGLMIPLTLYPVWLQKMAYLTPFSAILGERSQLAIHFGFYEVAWVFLSLLFWGLVGLLFLSFLYRKGLRLIHMEGG